MSDRQDHRVRCNKRVVDTVFVRQRIVCPIFDLRGCRSAGHPDNRRRRHGRRLHIDIADYRLRSKRGTEQQESEKK
jgi:hypothetical protein